MQKIKHIFTRNVWATLYVLVFILFAVIYSSLPSDAFKESPQMHFWNSLYFSIVTITTLGYGDVTPTTDFAKILVSVESLVGLFLLGMFLNLESRRASQNNNKNIARKGLNQCCQNLLFVEERLRLALKEQLTTKLDSRIRCSDIAYKLANHPEMFDFNKNIIDDIYWCCSHVINDFRVFSTLSIEISGSTYLRVSTIITNLERIEDAPIRTVSMDEAYEGAESLQTRLYHIFNNVVGLMDE